MSISTLVVQGVFADRADGTRHFAPAPAPADRDVARLLAIVQRRFIRLVARHGIDLATPSAETDDVDPRRLASPAYVAIQAAAVLGRIATGARAGARVIFYTWGMNTPPFTMNGTMVSIFLAALNARGGFAGHTDWRIPNRFELESLLNFQNPGPAVDPVFFTGCLPGCAVTSCSCTAFNFYWSSTTYYQSSPPFAWLVSFFDGDVTLDDKSNNYYVRAVRNAP